MKTLEQIQEENRKFIIMANNPSAKTYDQAVNEELSKNYHKQKEVYYIPSGDPWSPWSHTVSFSKEYAGAIFGDIIKLTLNKVLIAFGRESLDLWEDLEKEKLEEQSEETQRKFNELIYEI